METMSIVWLVVGAIWAAVVAAIAYLNGMTTPILLILAWWAVPMLFPGTFVAWAICEKYGWV